MKKLVTDLKKIERLGRMREEENMDFRIFLKGRHSEKVDAVVHQLHKDISRQIDCTECGNCCNSLRPSVSKENIQALAKLESLSEKDFKDKYVAKDEFYQEEYLKSMPCHYLKDKKCTIYDQRPEDCRSYPHTHKEGFTSRLFGVLNNYSKCPIVFNILEHLKRELKYRYR